MHKHLKKLCMKGAVKKVSLTRNEVKENLDKKMRKKIMTGYY